MSAHAVPADLHLIRRAIREEWDVPPETRTALLQHFMKIIRKNRSHRIGLLTAQCVLDADKANLRSWKRLLKLAKTHPELVREMLDAAT